MVDSSIEVLNKETKRLSFCGPDDDMWNNGKK